MNRQALLIVDVQNNFCPGGALPVQGGDEVVLVINQYVEHFMERDMLIFASRDWHPKKTKHFKEYGGRWPEHCVQNTHGAEFHKDLKLPKKTIVLSKGMDPNEDGYSAFEGKDKGGIDFTSLLTQYDVKELFVCGLATDFCVKNSVLEAIKNFKVYLLGDAIRGVNLNPGDAKKAIGEMVSKGAKVLTLIDFDE